MHDSDNSSAAVAWPGRNHLNHSFLAGNRISHEQDVLPVPDYRIPVHGERTNLCGDLLADRWHGNPPTRRLVSYRSGGTAGDGSRPANLWPGMPPVSSVTDRSDV